MWARIHASSPEPPSLVEVDFSREMVVVVALGGQSTGGYSILIEKVFDRGDHLEVVVRREEPSRRCLTAQAFSAPTDIARLRKDERPVRFVERQVVDECF